MRLIIFDRSNCQLKISKNLLKCLEQHTGVLYNMLGFYIFLYKTRPGRKSTIIKLLYYKRYANKRGVHDHSNIYNRIFPMCYYNADINAMSRHSRFYPLRACTDA